VRAPIGRGGTGCGRVVEVRDGAVRARHGGKRLPLNRFGQALFSGETIIADEQEAWSPEGGLGRWSCPRLLPARASPFALPAASPNYRDLFLPCSRPPLCRHSHNPIVFALAQRVGSVGHRACRCPSCGRRAPRSRTRHLQSWISPSHQAVRVSLQKKTQGTRLDLAIVSRIMTLHGLFAHSGRTEWGRGFNSPGRALVSPAPAIGSLRCTPSVD
jgi:hypothetical protein